MCAFETPYRNNVVPLLSTCPYFPQKSENLRNQAVYSTQELFWKTRLVGQTSNQIENSPGSCHLWGGGCPKRLLTPLSVTHLSLYFTKTKTRLPHWIFAYESSYRPSKRHFNNSVSVRFPLQQRSTHGWGAIKGHS